MIQLFKLLGSCHNNRGLDAGGQDGNLINPSPMGTQAHQMFAFGPNRGFASESPPVSFSYVSVGKARRQHFPLNSEVSFIKNVCYSQLVSKQFAN